MIGVCQYCHCTEDEPCPQGCAWHDASKELCSVCAAAKLRAMLVLAGLTPIYPVIDATAKRTPDELWGRYPVDQQTLLVMTLRAALEVVPEPESDDALLASEVRTLAVVLQERFPQEYHEAQQRQSSLAEFVLGLIESGGKRVVLAGS